ncbi:hypothetical protein LOZ58_005488 [Ophidiomyces ophidiicola]|nr:hypothetical protein LOZ65_000956 [Ophidiomyces ophidiicola]KAI1933799.1 hypothetical protein LOZ66_006307 [Ophidiomyces ophidiicola]KAI1957738.1 hypothetical protein LOZ58_005488 [Ophidiomyces ophidiicola]
MVLLLAIASVVLMPTALLAATLPSGSSRIIGGTPAKLAQFPDLISLEEGSRHVCGGMLLNGRFVLTAAHCLIDKHNLTVRAGTLVSHQETEQDYETPLKGGQTARVAAMQIHPKYNEKTSLDDVAVLYLSSSIRQSQTIKYSKLPDSGSDPVPNSLATAAGWGITSTHSQQTDKLLFVSIPITSRSTCQELYMKLNISIPEETVCSGYQGRAACVGDSGGPLYDAANMEVVGITSFAHDCGQKGPPGVYMKVASYLSWIHDTMGRLRR